MSNLPVPAECCFDSLEPTLTRAQECLDAAVAALDGHSAADHVVAARLFLTVAIDAMAQHRDGTAPG